MPRLSLFITLYLLLFKSFALGAKDKVWKGSVCDPGTYPFMVAIRNKTQVEKNESSFCGGTVLTALFIMTAAHCTWAMEYEPYYVVANPLSALSETIPIRKFIKHEEYSDKKKNYDIAILILVHKIRYPSTVRIHREIQGEISVMCRKAMAMGWGENPSRLVDFKNLMCLKLTIMSTEECEKASGKRPNKRVVCTRGEDGGDVCRGDSGGPLMCKFYQVGIVSRGPECGSHTFVRPGKWVRPDQFYDWIQDVIQRETKYGKTAKSNEGLARRSWCSMIAICIVLILIHLN